MDWIHCNSCFRQPNEQSTPQRPQQPQQEFYLTSCGHIFCHNCGCFADGKLPIYQVIKYLFLFVTFAIQDVTLANIKINII